MNSDEVLRRLVLSATDGNDGCIARLLRTVVPDAHIAWASVSGITLSVYCYKQRDGHKLEREFGGNTFRSVNPRDRDYFIWQWEAPLA